MPTNPDTNDVQFDAGTLTSPSPTSAPANAAQPTGTPAGPTEFDAGSLTTDTPAQPAQPEGEQKNDVGNTVIVPKEGENYADTMKRVVSQGKKTTPEQIAAEVHTMPKKAAQVIASAPAIGAGGTAGLAGMGEMIVHSPAVAKAVLQHISEPGTILKFPYGRAAEYFLMTKMGLSQSHLSDLVKYLPAL
jgi:hypothetical protein